MAYTIKKYHGSYNRTRRSSKPKYIVWHYVGSGTSATGSARANCKYFAGGNRNASAHYFIDNGTIYEYADPDSWYTWHCGTKGRYYSSCRNSNSIGIEVCQNHDKPFTQGEIDRLVWLTKRLMSEFDIPLSNVIRHYDVTRKSCPYYYTPAGSGGTTAFKKLREKCEKSAAKEIYQVEVDGYFGPDTAELAQAIEGIDRNGRVYHQPTCNKKCFALSKGQAAAFVFEGSGKAGGSLLVRRIQNDQGIPWSKCDGFWGPDTTKRFIKEWVTSPTHITSLHEPSVAVKNNQRHLNKVAKQKKIYR